jgi:DNA (cytosine-5)-methyltransferase 1
VTFNFMAGGKQTTLGYDPHSTTAGTLNVSQTPAVTCMVQPYNIVGCGQQGRNHAYATETSGCLQHKGLSASGNEAGTVLDIPAVGVRRLTPLECERLQGLPDQWTFVPFRGKPAADGLRYRAIGNSFAVPVVRWIGERIGLVEAI